jgi:cobalt-zinc-cadmium efflux system outer membrane protein
MRQALIIITTASAAWAQATLADFEAMAIKSHPALAQAQSSIEAAEGRRVQAGLWPNPVVGASGDHNGPGIERNGGLWGAFVEQRIVTGGKLSLDRKAAAQEKAENEARRDAERLRVLTRVRSLFWETLGEQRQVEVAAELERVARINVETAKQLANIGQADRPDVLASEVEAQRASLSLQSARLDLERAWRQLTAEAGQPGLPLTTVTGSLDDVPKLEPSAALSRILTESPELKEADAGVSRSEFALARAKKEKLPDLQLTGGWRFSREREGIGLPLKGSEAYFDAGVEIPIFNRYQGKVAEAKAELERSKREGDRIRMQLRQRTASAWRDYRDAVNLAERYKAEMIPRAKEAYELYVKNFRAMQAAYPLVLTTQRTLFELEREYVESLVHAHQAAAALEGLVVLSDMSR